MARVEEFYEQANVIHLDPGCPVCQVVAEGGTLPHGLKITKPCKWLEWWRGK